MITTPEEKLRKVRTLYERATNPGEKAAAFEALKRMGANVKSTTVNSSGVSWLEDMKKFLVSRGFYACTWRGDIYIYKEKRGSVKVTIEKKANGGIWKILEPYAKKFKTGNSVKDLDGYLSGK